MKITGKEICKFTGANTIALITSIALLIMTILYQVDVSGSRDQIAKYISIKSTNNN